MTKKRPKVSLARSVQSHKGDLEKLFATEDDAEQAAGLQLLAIRVDAIYPDPEQPRRTFPPESLQELSDSIKQDGVIQPIEVTETGPNQYKIVHGERRWRAAQLAGLTTVPAVVRRRDYDTITRFVRQMVENIQREDLNDIDRAAGLVRLKELLQEELDASIAEGKGSGKPHQKSITWAKVGKRLGYSRQRIHQLIQLLKLPDEIKEDVRAGRLSERETRVYRGLLVRQQRDLHRARMAESLTPQELKWVARHLKESPDKPVDEAVREIRTAGLVQNEKSERTFTSSFGQGHQDAALPRSGATGQRWVARQSGQSRKNAQNINRVHWARDHLSRIQLQSLGPVEQQALIDLLARLQQDIDHLITTLRSAGHDEEEK